MLSGPRRLHARPSECRAANLTSGLWWLPACPAAHVPWPLTKKASKKAHRPAPARDPHKPPPGRHARQCAAARRGRRACGCRGALAALRPGPRSSGARFLARFSAPRFLTRTPDAASPLRGPRPLLRGAAHTCCGEPAAETPTLSASRPWRAPEPRAARPRTALARQWNLYQHSFDAFITGPRPDPRHSSHGVERAHTRSCAHTAASARARGTHPPGRRRARSLLRSPGGTREPPRRHHPLPGSQPL